MDEQSVSLLKETRTPIPATKERERSEVLSKLAKSSLSLLQALALLRVSYRQVLRLWKRSQLNGAAGLKHRLRDRLVKMLRLQQIRTLKSANAYLEYECLGELNNQVPCHRPFANQSASAPSVRLEAEPRAVPPRAARGSD